MLDLCGEIVDRRALAHQVEMPFTNGTGGSSHNTQRPDSVRS
jgi:hypothetical protein